MKAAQLYAYDEEMNVELKIETVPEPTISDPEDVIVRVGAAGLCRTDLHIIEGVWRDVMDARTARCCPTSWDMKTRVGLRRLGLA